MQKKTTKNGDPMAVVTLEDMEGETTLVIFPKLYKKCAEALTPHVDEETGEAEAAPQSVGELFAAFYADMTGRPLNGEQREIVSKTLKNLEVEP